MMVNRTKTNLLIISHLHDACSQQVQKLIQIADAAAELRQPDLLLEASSTLYKLGQDEASHFYLALANRRRTGQETPSRAILSDLAERAGKLWRAKALTTLGTLDFHKGNHREATDYYAQARRLSPDSLIYLHTAQMTAIISGCDGDHKSAAAVLLNTLPLASSKGIHGLNHRNSLAVELNALGRVEEARYYLQPCLNSPYKIYYPEWQETSLEIHTATRNRVYIHSPLTDKIASLRNNLRLALMDNVRDFDKWQKKGESAKASGKLRFQLGTKILDAADLSDAAVRAIEEVFSIILERQPTEDELRGLPAVVKSYFEQSEQRP